jgi:hypothetical protein
MGKKIKKDKEDKDSQAAPIYGDPEYSAEMDIYSREKKVSLIDSDEDGKPIKGAGNKMQLGEDLDVPGAELDDQDEQIGEEDEENNYYSLGGDDHDDLEEDKGE